MNISYVGMDDKTVPIKGNNVTITLTSNEQSLSEVVVTGYGVQRKAAFTEPPPQWARILLTSVLMPTP